MHQIKYALFAAALMMLDAGAVHAQSPGDWVLGNFRNAGYWVPGVIEKIEGGQVTIRYGDGEKETVTDDDVRPYDWFIGRKVECNFKNRGTWHAGTITFLAGEKIAIAYDEGGTEITRTSLCRSK